MQKRKIQEIEISSDEEEESPPVPLKRKKLKKASPVLEPLPKTKVKVKVIGSRPPHVVIREPTEQEIAARLNNPSESDNSSPDAEIPPKVITSTPHDRLITSTSFFFFSIVLITIL